MYFESHAHYDDKRFDEDRHELLMKMHKNGVDYIVNAGATMKSSCQGIEMSKKYDFVYASVGVHPHDVKDMTEKDIDTLKDMCLNNKKVVSVGEIGLDFYYDYSPRDVQIHWFKKQLSMSEEVGKPVIIHSRDASQPCFDIIKESCSRRGVIHCYSGDVEMALEYCKMGFFIGIGGVITFGNAKKLVDVVSALPLEKILLETDAPYLSPNPNRGTRNDSQNLKYICDKIAEIKKVSPEEVYTTTHANCCSLFFNN